MLSPQLTGAAAPLGPGTTNDVGTATENTRLRNVRLDLNDAQTKVKGRSRPRSSRAEEWVGSTLFPRTIPLYATQYAHSFCDLRCSGSDDTPDARLAEHTRRARGGWPP